MVRAITDPIMMVKKKHLINSMPSSPKQIKSASTVEKKVIMQKTTISQTKKSLKNQQKKPNVFNRREIKLIKPPLLG